MKSNRSTNRRWRLREKTARAAADLNAALDARGIEHLVAMRVGDSLRITRVEPDERQRIIGNLKITEDPDGEA
jgi:hypothetical protein